MYDMSRLFLHPLTRDLLLLCAQVSKITSSRSPSSRCAPAPHRRLACGEARVTAARCFHQQRICSPETFHQIPPPLELQRACRHAASIPCDPVDHKSLRPITSRFLLIVYETRLGAMLMLLLLNVLFLLLKRF